MTRSIVQPGTKACYITGSTTGLDQHHCLRGQFRKKADELGLWVWLRHDVHMRMHERKPPFEDLEDELKLTAQRAFESERTREEWMAIFGRSWLDE